MKQLNIKDKKILHQLDINARQSNTEIARKVGISKQAVGYKINKLMKEKILASFYTVIDISKLGFTNHKNFLRLQNMDKERENEFIAYMKQHPNILWCASCDGKYDFVFGTWAKDMEYLDKTLKEIEQKYGSYISERQIATIIRGQYYVRDYLLGKKERTGHQQSFFGSVPMQTEMDISNWKILVELGKNARVSVIQIAANIQLSADAVATRIKKMEKAGIIRQYNIVPNEAVFPYLHYKVLIGFRNITEQKEKAFQEYCRRNSNIVYTVKALGPWEYEVDMEVEHAQQYREIMMEIKTLFNDILQDYSTLHLYQVHKYNFCPSVQL